MKDGMKGFQKAFLFCVSAAMVYQVLNAAGVPVKKVVNFVVDIFIKAVS
jgi:hypothetical protein